MWNRASSSGGGETKLFPAAQGPAGPSSISQGQGESICVLAPVLPLAGTMG